MKREMRRQEREITDKEMILDILNRSQIVHLGLVDEGEPYVVPMNYGYVMDDKLTLYLHSAKDGYKLDVLRKNPKVCFEMECDVQQSPGTVACQYGTLFKSVIGRGKAEIVEDVQEKKKALSILMKTQTRKDFEFNEQMVSAVSVLKIVAEEYTAKARLQ